MSTQLSTSECTIDFTTSPAWFRSIRHLITSATKQCGFSESEAGQVSMAVDEALSNIYRHGYQGATDGRVRLSFTTTCEPRPQITIELNDDAKQIETHRIQSRNLEDVKPGGLGVHLIKSIMDFAVWEQRPEGGMKLSMSKQAKHNPDLTIQPSIQNHG